ncbi:baseplate J/gp47 family protein [Kordiimonas lacus]|uniref:Baseplate J-like protein n=1 Tax=Kordiimonas lacus TaxID=637679 RepID=A0A1G7A5W0_9PROT|nr:baseplate J/gp47 family protein [Kordiimonas lacus]SDE09435.1 Baseplate J-like protein [Kordiimonas lacus]
MKDPCCTPRHPLLRDGTSQAGRAPLMLDPKKVELDDRSLADLLAWATKYGKELVFYNSNNRISGDWVSFIEDDPSTLIALISLYDHRAFLGEFRAQEETVLAFEGTEQDQFDSFRALCGKLIDLAALFDGWFQAASPELAVYHSLKTTIRADLAPAMHRLIAYDAAAGLDLAFTDGTKSILGLDFSALSDASSVWGFGNQGLVSGVGIFQGDDFKEMLSHAVGRISALFDTMHRVLVRTVNEAPTLLEDSLRWPKHQPHMALYIAFLKIFGLAQKSLNSLTEKHLKYYYEEVLCLARQPSVPDEAHLVFTLAGNQTGSFALGADTRFKAGKDADGKDLVYKLSKSCSLNRASVEEIRALYIEGGASGTSLHTSLEAASNDGQGEAFEDADKVQWLTFGQDNSRPSPTLGLVIASPLLRLGEGTRTIALTVGLPLDITLPDLDTLNNLFSAAVSTAEGWLDAPKPTVELGDAEDKQQLLSLTFTIPADEPAIAAFALGTEDALFDTEWPLMKLVADGGKVAEQFALLAATPLQSLSLQVSVSGMQNFLVENDQGPVPSNKPFAAFGSTPRLGSRLLIGSWEMLQKQLSSLTLTIEWDDLPNFATHYAGYGETITNAGVTCSVAFLDKTSSGGWKDQTPKTNTLFVVNVETKETDEEADKETAGGETTASSTSFELKIDPVSGWSRTPDLETFTSFGNSLNRGYVRVTLDHTLLHEKYLQVYTTAALQLATASLQPSSGNNDGQGNDDADPTPTVTLPNAPFVPLAKTVKLGYTASDDWDLTKLATAADVGQLFHLHPFGHSPVTGSKVTLLPDYDSGALPASTTGNGATKQAGTLYIGFKDIPAVQSSFALSLLMQVVEGTEDPTLNVLPTVNWAYLAGDTWVDLEKDVTFEDNTDGLLKAGIITFKIGADATTSHTLLPSGMMWLRASVDRDPAGVCDMVSLHAQAAKVKFEDQNNAASHLSAALPKETIAKMVNKDARISSVAQPYASFGGQMAEQDDDFYIRVSERLRHKERAVTIWDYERLVLEHFPDIYKVKCISHATHEREIAPGNVAVVVVPNVRNKNGFDRLKPYASQATRRAIKALLGKRSPHNIASRIEVLTPAFEEITTHFNVVYNDQVADFDLASDQLAEDIVRFLSPWAFSEGRDIVFGNKIHASAIVDFIDERPYVDSVHNFVMTHTAEGGQPKPVIEAEALSARSVLVAAAKERHKILRKGVSL